MLACDSGTIEPDTGGSSVYLLAIPAYSARSRPMKDTQKQGGWEGGCHPEDWHLKLTCGLYPYPMYPYEHANTHTLSSWKVGWLESEVPGHTSLTPRKQRGEYWCPSHGLHFMQWNPRPRHGTALIQGEPFLLSLTVVGTSSQSSSDVCLYGDAIPARAILAFLILQSNGSQPP